MSTHTHVLFTTKFGHRIATPIATTSLISQVDGSKSDVVVVVVQEARYEHALRQSVKTATFAEALAYVV